MLKNRLSYIILFIFAAAFIFIALKGLKTAQPGDENVYYYMGRLVSEGKVLYRDFFFAHPPLQIYLLALIHKIFGFNIIVLKLIPLVSTLATGFFVFKIAKEKFGNLEAVISCLLFLFSYSVMFNSVFSFGIDIATTFLVIGVYFLWNNNKPGLAGIFLGLAAVTRLLTLVPIIIILMATLLSNKKIFLKLSSIFLIVFLVVNGSFILFLGDNYLIPVYKYHLLKSFDIGGNLKEYMDIVKLNWILFLSAALLFFVKEKKHINIFVTISIIYLLLLTLLNKIFGFYFIVIFPFLAIIGGYSLVKITRKLNLSKKWGILISIILLSIFAWNLTADILFLEKIGFAGFERNKDLIEFINSKSDKNTALFGDESIVPLLALKTNKKIALDFVDTNNQIFISGVKNLNNVLNDLKGKDVLFIARSGQGLSHFSETREFLNENCEFLSQFHDKIEGDYIIYKCK